MNTLTETPVGSTLSLASFRPTEAQKAVLLNIDELASEDRNTTEQDAVNIPEETLKAKKLSIENLDGAYEILVKLGIISVDGQGLITLSSEGMSIVEEIKKEGPSTEMGDTPPSPMDGDELPAKKPAEIAAGGPEGGPPSPAQPALESINLIRELRDLSIIQERLKS